MVEHRTPNPGAAGSSPAGPAILYIIWSSLLFKKIKKFLKEVWLETVPPTGKVSWPDRKLTLNSTLIVIVAIIIVSFYIGIIDLILTKVVSLIVGS